MTWKDYAVGSRIVFMVERRGGQLAVRASGPEREALEGLGLDGKSERGVFCFFLTPAVLEAACAAVGEHPGAWLRAQVPDWSAWLEREGALDAVRESRRGLLSCSSRLAEPDLVSKASFEAWSTDLPPGHPAHALWPYQQFGVWWFSQADGRGVIGDDMGLGKTGQALTYAELTPAVRRVIAVTPAAVAWNWTREAARWAPSLWTRVIKSSKDAPKAVIELRRVERGLLVVTWGLLHRVLDVLLSAEADFVVLDEAHRMKEADTLRTRAALVLAHASPRRALLTGTYLRSRYRELWTLLHAVAPRSFPSFRPFGERFCDPRNIDVGGRTVRVYEGSKKPQALLRETMPWVIRREKLEVLKDLPPKRRQKLHLSAPVALVERTRAFYDALKKATEEDALADSSLLVEIGKLWREAGLCKVDPSVEWIEDAVYQGEPLVVFIYHKAIREKLEIGLDNLGIGHVAVVGDMNAKQKDKAVQQFLNGDVPVLIGSDAAKEGLNLVRACMSLHVERWWVPADEEQAEDRLFRMGQKKPVLNVYPHLHGSLDDYVDRVGSRKRQLVSAATSPASLPALLRQILIEECRG